MMANISQNKNSIGKKTSYIGILGSLFISLIEFVCGSLSGCVSLIYNGIHDILDCFSSGLSFVAFKISDKKPNNKFPTGFGRIQYIMNLIISEIIIVVGLIFIQSSYQDLFLNRVVVFNAFLFLMMIFAIGVKLFLSLYFNKQSKKIDSVILKSVSIDNRNDIFIICIAIMPMICALFHIHCNIDSICGLIIGCIVCISGIKMLIQSGELLIGKSVSNELMNQVKDVIMKEENVVSILELNLYDFVNCYYGSAKVIVDDRLSLDDSSKLAYDIETKLSEWLNVDMTVRVTDNKYKLSL